ncbi:hypothetical protein N8654_02030 [Synechococcus sp. AH-601-B19]|nr:hypothetical protein [Synechococcus sp. AH-601-B19]
MNPDIEQILLAQAAREAEQGPRLSDVVALGAGGGAALGAALGGIPHAMGNGVNRALDVMAPIHPMTRGTNGALAQAREAKPRGRMFKPGFRMAGGLVGTILGGGLGAAMQQEAVSEPSGAGALLAKIQATGEVTAEDEMRLESVLRDAYTQQGLLG